MVVCRPTHSIVSRCCRAGSFMTRLLGHSPRTSRQRRLSRTRPICDGNGRTLIRLRTSSSIAPQAHPPVRVLGFKGCEPTDEPGRYIVRQSHAHAWVEALIEDYQPRPWWEV